MNEQYWLLTTLQLNPTIVSTHIITLHPSTWLREKYNEGVEHIEHIFFAIPITSHEYEKWGELNATGQLSFGKGGE